MQLRRPGPVLIAFDGTPAAAHAIREGGPLLAGRKAVATVVWKQGLNFELVALPASRIGLPPASIDVNTASRSIASCSRRPRASRSGVPRARARWG